jgi:ribosomal protein L35AE/L33A
MACSGVGANRHGDRVIRVHGTKGAIRAFDLAA